MGKLDKQLRRIPLKERREIEDIIEKIIARDLSKLDIKKLRGVKNIFRARKGNFRIIFEFRKLGPRILSIDRRGDHTYDF